MYFCYYKCFQADKIVKYLHVLVILQWLGFIQNLETLSCWGGFGGMSCKNHDLGGLSFRRQILIQQVLSLNHVFGTENL